MNFTKELKEIEEKISQLINCEINENTTEFKINQFKELNEFLGSILQKCNSLHTEKVKLIDLYIINSVLVSNENKQDKIRKLLIKDYNLYVSLTKYAMETTAILLDQTGIV